jgi:3-hydroxyisobutyrate dehydrogenase
MRITFLGTGIMGAPMARHLAEAGHEVTVWNRTADKARPLAEHGASVAEDPAAAATGAEVVVTMLTDGEAVEDVMGEAAPALAEGTIWWQASTVGVAGTEALVALAEDHGLTLVDAPVLGTKGPAEAGELVILASGPNAAIETLTPLFRAVGSKILTFREEPGRATRFKLVMNHWVLALTNAIAETIAFAEAVEINPACFLDTIEGGALDVGYAHLKGPGMIANDLPVAFPLKHALKDADLILEAGDRHALDLALAHVMRESLAAAAVEGHGDDDMGMVVAAARATSAR